MAPIQFSGVKQNHSPATMSSSSGRSKAIFSCSTTGTEIGMPDILSARKRIERHAKVTPVFTSSTLSGMCQRDLSFKMEVFQKTGSFKIRGALNAIFSLTDEEAAKGVVTHSSGNHAQAVALAANGMFYGVSQVRCHAKVYT